MNIADIISPLIFIASLGYICAKTKWLSKTQLDGISKFTFNLAIPAFLFIKMANANIDKNLSLTFFLAFYLPVLCCYALAATINFYFHPQLSKNFNASAVFALGSSYSNTVIVGLPILLAMYGQQALMLIFAIVTFHSAMLFTLTSVIAAKNQQNSWLKTLINTFKNPLLISILLGALVNLLHIPMPNMLSQSLLLLSKPAISLALFILGASLTFFSLKAQLSFMSISSFIKIILLPLLVYFCATNLFALPEIQRNVLVILSACPTGVNAYLIAKNFNAYEQTIASTVVFTTIISVISLSAWMWWLN